MDKETLETILSYGVMAPSGDNSQPWSFVWDGKELEIYAHPEYDSPILNTDNCGTYMAIGALVTNITYAAPAYGYDVRAHYLTPDTHHVSSTPVVRIQFVRRTDTQNDSSYLAALAARMTHRLPYTKTPLDQTILTTYADNSIASTPELTVHVCTDHELITRIATYASTFERIMLGNKHLHAGFFGNILWDEQAAQQGIHGLPIHALGLPLPVRALFRVFKHWSVMRVLARLGLPSNASKSNAHVYASCGAMIVVTAPSIKSSNAFFRIGETMERVWIEGVHHGYVLQPLAGLIYLAYALKHKPTLCTEKEHAAVVHALQGIYQAYSIPANQYPVMMFRIGVPNTPMPGRTHRKPPTITYT